MTDPTGKRKLPEQQDSDSNAGMAWGANSPSSLTRMANKDDGMGDFGRYMSEKQRKLRLQFVADTSNQLISGSIDVGRQNSSAAVNAGNSRSIKNLFEGISIFVNGFTVPSHQELRNLMIKHGGRFENYFTKDHVTHIVCSILPDSKIIDPRSLSRGLPIVKPEWIVDSIANGKVLPVSSYYLKRLAFEHPNQRTLSTFVTIENDGKNNGCTWELDCSTLHETEGVRQDAVVKHGASLRWIPDSCAMSNKRDFEGDATPYKEDMILQSQHKVDAGPMSISSDKLAGRGENRHMSGDKHIHMEDLLDDSKEVSLKPKALQNSLCNSLEHFETGSARASKIAGHTGHCTLRDANFVHNYFKHSRLHFIGTWRNRYHSRLSSGLIKGQNEEETRSDSSSSKVDTSFDRVIMHIDMDCFFVSVVVRSHPILKERPVAVCHSNSALGTAEISSANYPARAFGIRAGMFVRDAKELCPGLEIVPYDFQGYEEVADQFYDILHKYCNKVQAVSCDEAYMDVTGLGDVNNLASTIRKEIFDLTKCTASIGIAGNPLLARMATRKAKPDGQYQIEPEQVDKFISNLSVGDLPGVGWALREKLQSQNVYNCSQLRTLSKDSLQREYGPKTGEMLWCYARGMDCRQVQITQERKSIGAEVNWGVRFNHPKEAENFLATLCEEVCERLHDAVVIGRTFTLKLKKRKEGASEPAKFMGCGSCDNLSKSFTAATATDNVDILLRVSKQMFSSFHLNVQEIRGIGLQVTRLEPKCASRPSEKPISVLWSVTGSDEERESKCSLGKVLKGPFSGQKQQGLYKDKRKQKTIPEQLLPPVSQLDHSVLVSLPPDILAEIKDAYGVLLTEHMLDKKLLVSGPIRNEGMDTSLCTSSSSAFMPVSSSMHESFAHRSKGSSEQVPAEVITIFEDQQKMEGSPRQSKKSQSELARVAENYEDVKDGCSCTPRARTSTSECSNQIQSTEDGKLLQKEVMPLSMSQVDMSTLKELPYQLQHDILRALPAHRPLEERMDMEGLKSMNAVIHSADIGKTMNTIDSHSVRIFGENLFCNCKVAEPSELADLWLGHPPKWVALFKNLQLADSIELSLLAENYSKCCPHQDFSSVLLDFTFHYTNSFYGQSVETQESICCCLELFKQYIQIKISQNIEEVSMVLRLLKWLSGKSLFWATVYKLILPTLQVMIGESYGGILALS